MPNAVVTGANRGIGLELSRQLAAADWTVWACCRQSSPELAACAAEVWEGVDVASDGVAAPLREAIGARRVDLLLLNAGILRRESLQDLDWDSMRAQYEVNALGPLRVTEALLPNLGDGSKVVVITSRMGSIGDNSSGGRYGYRMSKAAVNIAGASLAVDLRPQGIAVALVHPGFVRTDMTGGQGLIDPPEAAAGILERAAELSLHNSGSFWHSNGQELPW